MAESTRDFVSAWEDYRAVVVLAQRRGRGKLSGMELDQLGDGGINVMHVRSGRVTRMVLYSDRERALADLGLED